MLLSHAATQSSMAFANKSSLLRHFYYIKLHAPSKEKRKRYCHWKKGWLAEHDLQ